MEHPLAAQSPFKVEGRRRGIESKLEQKECCWDVPTVRAGKGVGEKHEAGACRRGENDHFHRMQVNGQGPGGTQGTRNAGFHRG